jgi:hypothetical protein
MDPNTKRQNINLDHSKNMDKLLKKVVLEN